jgi:excisionase family DNA binding protein
MATTIDGPAVAAEENERQALDQIQQVLSPRNGTEPLKLLNERGQEALLPESLVTVLRQAVSQLTRHKLVTIVPLDRELTTQEAAALLNISRPYLIRLLEQGAIPYSKTGTHRRIRYDDLMRYKVARDASREQALDELTRINQEMGLYEAQ